MSVIDDFDLKLQGEVGPWGLPGVWVVPTEHIPITKVEVGEFWWFYWNNNNNNKKEKLALRIYIFLLQNADKNYTPISLR